MSVKTAKDEFLEVINDNQRLTAFFNDLEEKNTTIEEIIDLISKKEIETVMNSLSNNVLCIIKGNSFESHKESNSQNLSKIVTQIYIYLIEKDFRITLSFKKSIDELVDVLFDLNGNKEIQNNISLIGELCWVKNVEGRENLIPKIIPHLLIRCIEETASRPIIKRM